MSNKSSDVILFEMEEEQLINTHTPEHKVRLSTYLVSMVLTIDY